MAESTARERKLIQYLNEAYGKERELETALQAHISMTTRAPYRKRLQEHLRETRAQSKALERRIGQLGGTAELGLIAAAADAAATVAKKGAALAKGPLHALRGTGEAEQMLKNAKTEYFNEHEEIATYLGLEALATALGDEQTARLAVAHRRQEERMAKFLERQIPALARAVVAEEIPARDRRPATAASVRSRSRRSGGRTGASRSTRDAGATRAAGSARARRPAAGSPGPRAASGTS